MPAFAKPVSPAWQPGLAPAGCKLYLPMTEGAGLSTRDYASSYNGTFVGSPTWQRGLYGPQLGGFTENDHVTLDPAVSIFAEGPPFWIAAMFSGLGTSVIQSTLVDGFNVAGGIEITLYVNASVSGQVAIFVQNDNGQRVDISANGTSINDGNPHILMFSSDSSASHGLYLDGVQVANSSSDLVGPITLQTCNLGVQKAPSAIRPFPGSILWAGAGNGSVPEPLALAAGQLSGRFAAVRRRSSLGLLAAATAAQPSAGNLFFSGGLSGGLMQVSGGLC